ncbi:putative fluoride ion transporter CrcB 2 [Asanoa ishikariensis]|uniref:Fluoride-specific ion channel FluC n=1 Tax=Asanoa ishikariensis TaxID=137265 RepID=A0A1H3R663_9ACTN|nr:fluoride efflux transporter CrcB [Asanoa ishikariensis]GIF64387.1 putative fluoride ion transporter CrcB 2 [Asanoa ishikariensis]SDZ21013.1 CrcB protein [Asanoa ishikariensis]
MTVLFVALGAAVGAPLRYLTGRAVQRLYRGHFPAGTLIVNVVGSFVLGLAAGGTAPTTGVFALVGTGFCGALSTYSTFGYETVRLLEQRLTRTAIAYAAVSVAAGLGAAAAGVAIGLTVWR